MNAINYNEGTESENSSGSTDEFDEEVDLIEDDDEEVESDVVEVSTRKSGRQRKIIEDDDADFIEGADVDVSFNRSKRGKKAKVELTSNWRLCGRCGKSISILILISRTRKQESQV